MAAPTTPAGVVSAFAASPRMSWVLRARSRATPETAWNARPRAPRPPVSGVAAGRGRRTEAGGFGDDGWGAGGWDIVCLLYTSDAADDLLCVDLGGRRIIKKKNK